MKMKKRFSSAAGHDMDVDRCALVERVRRTRALNREPQEWEFTVYPARRSSGCAVSLLRSRCLERKRP